MALLTLDERKAIFKSLGYGEYNESSIKAFQRDYLLRGSDVDGKYGSNTDNALRTVYYTKYYTKNFSPKEFVCECGGKYCCGYPDYMKPAELIHIQNIRDHYGRPIKITSGLRCKTWNKKCGGSIQNSLHMSGLALDFYQSGVTDTLGNRKASIKWIKKQPNHHYTYGNGINSYGNGVSAPYMGNALHTDTNNNVEPVHPKYDGGSEPTPTPQPTSTPTPTPKARLTVDGIGGKATVRLMQEYFDCVVDGFISGQMQSQHKYYPSLTAVTFTKKNPKGSPCVKKLQKWLGVSADGILGEKTVKAWQKKLGVTADGIFGKNSMKAWQKFLNKEFQKKDAIPQETQKNPSEDATQPSAPIVEGKAPYKVIDVSDWQDKINWQKVRADGVVGAIIRYADGNTLDKRFDENMRGAIAAGLHVGAYIFSRAKTKKTAQSEAERLFNACKPYAVDMPLYIDLEASGLGKYADQSAEAFLNRIASFGGRGGVYANLNWWNNYLKDTARNYSSNAFWIAQYNDKMTYKTPGIMGMWQYSSSGTVNGIKGRVDMDWCYVAYWDKAVTPSEPITEPKPTEPITPPTEAETKPQEPITALAYKGEMPTLKITKTNAEVIADAVKWAVWIAGDNSFHYGYTNKHGSKDSDKWSPNAHHNGCYFCGTNTDKGGRSKKGIVDYKKTYCCNPFVGAAWAHGGCVQKALKLCQDGSSWDYHKGKGYDVSSLFTKLGKPKKSELKKGDVLCSNSHVALYIGDGKIVHASGGDDNVKGSKKWNNSIRVQELTDAKYKSFTRVYRYNSRVDATNNIYFGEISKRVEHLQHYLVWYGYAITADGIFGEQTHIAVKDMQGKLGLTADGIVGAMTLEAMGKVVR